MLKKSSKAFRALGVDCRQSLEGVPLASFSRRMWAFFIDFGLVVLVLGVPYIPKMFEQGEKTGLYAMNIDPFHGWPLLSLPLYFGIITYIGHGKTIGKKLLGVRVVSLAHDHLTLWHSIERSLGYGASFLEFGFGFFQYFIHPNCQTVHDRIGETIVIYDGKQRMVEKPKKAGRGNAYSCHGSCGAGSAPAIGAPHQEALGVIDGDGAVVEILRISAKQAVLSGHKVT
jgi:uncharacterized RDD family membrane protein YckC